MVVKFLFEFEIKILLQNNWRHLRSRLLNVIRKKIIGALAKVITFADSGKKNYSNIGMMLSSLKWRNGKKCNLLYSLIILISPG